MARYRKRPSYCQDLSGCPGGECGKCCYNPRSGYPVRIVRCTQEEAWVQQGLILAHILFAAWVMYWLRTLTKISPTILTRA